MWIHTVHAVRLRLAGELIEVQAKGKWEPPQPSAPATRELPLPHSDESHQSYFLRVLALFRGKPHSPEIAEWIATRKWAGESAETLRDAIAAGYDLPGHTWTFIKEPTL